MKKSIVIVCMAAMVLLAASCKKEKETGTQTVKLTAGIEQTGGSKTHVSNQVTYWKDGDAIMVNGNTLTMTGHADDWTTATFEGTWDLSKSPLPDGHNFINVVTPAIDQKFADGDWKSLVSVPMDQNYVENGFMDNLPMGCRTQAVENIALHNLADVFLIKVYASTATTITKVEMEKVCSNSKYEDNNPLAATIWYPHAGEDLEGVEIVSGTSYKIILNCKTTENPNGVTISTNPSTPTAFHFVTWPVQMGKGIVFRFYNESTLVATIQHSIRPQDKVEPNTLYTVCQNNATGIEDGNPYPLTDHLVPSATDETSPDMSKDKLKIKLSSINYGSGSAGQIGYLYCAGDKFKNPVENKLEDSFNESSYLKEVSVEDNPGWYCAYIKNDYGAFYGEWRYYVHVTTE